MSDCDDRVLHWFVVVKTAMTVMMMMMVVNDDDDDGTKLLVKLLQQLSRTMKSGEGS